MCKRNTKLHYLGAFPIIDHETFGFDVGEFILSNCAEKNCNKKKRSCALSYEIIDLNLNIFSRKNKTVDYAKHTVCSTSSLCSVQNEHHYPRDQSQLNPTSSTAHLSDEIQK